LIYKIIEELYSNFKSLLKKLLFVYLIFTKIIIKEKKEKD